MPPALSPFLAGLLPLLLVLLASAPARGDAPARIERGLAYTPATWPVTLRGDLYLPAGAGPHPVVLVVHGGSWRSGSRTAFDATRIARQLWREGFAAFAADYRLAPAHRFPAPLEDLAQAVHWLRAHAADYGLDAEAIGAWGYSAGGHLVAMLGTRDNRALGLRAVVAGGLPADLTRWPVSSPVRDFLGRHPGEDPQLAAAASPVSHAGPSSAPFFLYHGRWDLLVEPDHSRRLAEALAAAGIEVELDYLGGHGHVLVAMLPGRVVQQAVAFLRQRLVAMPVAPAPRTGLSR